MHGGGEGVLCCDESCEEGGLGDYGGVKVNLVWCVLVGEGNAWEYEEE